MSITRFQEFLVLAGHLNYTAAAKRLNITQSALSKHVMALEREFGATLIDRSGQQIELTRQGRLFCEEATKIVDAYESAQRRMKQRGREVRVTGAMRDSAVRALMARVATALRDGDEALEVSTYECPSSQIREELLSGRADVAVDVMAPGEEPDAELERAPLTSVPLIAVAKLGSPLADRESVGVRELAGERIMHPTGSIDIQRGAQAIEEVFRRHGVTMGKRVFFATSWSDFPAAELERNVFVMPRSLFSRQLFGHALNGCAGIPISDEDARFPYELCWRHGDAGEALARCMQAMHACARAMEQES